MKYSEVILACLQQNWNKLKEIIDDSSQHSYGILASAVIEVYGTPELKEKYGFIRWDNKLHHYLGVLTCSKFANLLEFLSAFKVAKAKIANLGLDDSDIANAIRTYVYAHQNQLAKLLIQPGLKSADKEALYKELGIDHISFPYKGAKAKTFTALSPTLYASSIKPAASQGQSFSPKI